MRRGSTDAAERRARQAEARAKVKALREALRHAISAKKLRMRELTNAIRAERMALRDRLQVNRKRVLEQLRDAANAERVKARAAWLARREQAKREATSDVDMARAELAAARAHQSEQRRIDAAHRADVAKHARGSREESDDQVRATLPRELVPLFDRVKRSIRGRSTESRAEALLRYAETHPEETFKTVEPAGERRVEAAREKLAEASRTVARAGRPTPRRKRVQQSLDLESTLWQSAAPPSPARKRRKGEVPRGEGMLLADLLRERAEIAEARAARAAKSRPAPAPPEVACCDDKPTVGATAPADDVAAAAKRAAFEAKRTARIQRMERKAARLGLEAERAHQGARAISDRIPMGQPILVGHHSERRHRRDIDKIQRGFSKAVALDKEAKALARRAKSAAKNRTISSDDPDAVTKLRAKLGAMERGRERMRSANAAIRAGGDVGGALARLGFTAEEAARLQERDFAGRTGFPDYRLTNTAAEVRRVKQRIAALESRAAAPPRPEESVGDARIAEAENRVRITFPGKPAEPVRRALKAAGFRWSPSVGAWQQHASESAWYKARRVLASVGQGSHA